MTNSLGINKFLGQGPFPFPAESITDYLELHMNINACVCLSKNPLLFSEDPIGHSHSSYEFMLPYNAMPYIKIENEAISAEADSLIPINSWHQHGPRGKMSIDCLLAVHFDKSFLDDISYHSSSSTDYYFDAFPLPCNKEIKYLMQYFIAESKFKQTGYEFILDSLCTHMAIYLLRHAKFNTGKRQESNKLHDNKTMKRVIEFLREQYYKDHYSLEEIAKLANLSPYHFIRTFKQQIGKTPYEYLIDIKIEKAKEMLKTRNHTILEICLSCGFSNHSHFTTTFKKRVGLTPTEYRNTNNLNP